MDTRRIFREPGSYYWFYPQGFFVINQGGIILFFSRLPLMVMVFIHTLNLLRGQWDILYPGDGLQ
jgi:hypothetical protein